MTHDESARQESDASPPGIIRRNGLACEAWPPGVSRRSPWGGHRRRRRIIEATGRQGRRIDASFHRVSAIVTWCGEPAPRVGRRDEQGSHRVQHPQRGLNSLWKFACFAWIFANPRLLARSKNESHGDARDVRAFSLSPVSMPPWPGRSAGRCRGSLSLIGIFIGIQTSGGVCRGDTRTE